MAPVKRKLTNKSLGKKCKALKDLENGLSNKDVATRNGVLTQHTVSTWVKSKHKLTAWLEKKGNEVLTKKYSLRESRKGR